MLRQAYWEQPPKTSVRYAPRLSRNTASAHSLSPPRRAVTRRSPSHLPRTVIRRSVPESEPSPLPKWNLGGSTIASINAKIRARLGESGKSLTKFSIVLDVDDTLVFFQNHVEDMPTELQNLEDEELQDRIYYITIYNDESDEGPTGDYKCYGFKRPDLKEFLEFCRLYFENVCVWSAGKYDYVHSTCDAIFAEDPDLIFTRKNCKTVEKRNGTHEYYKGLKQIYKSKKMKGKMNEKMTFVVDDIQGTFQKNPENAILIPKYRPEADLEGLKQEDTCLYDLVSYFIRDEVINSKDVRTLNKNRIF